MAVTTDLWDYLFRRIHLDYQTGCWLWDGCLNDSGYGVIGMRDYKNKRAHRVVFELFVGRIPDGFCACHRCDVRRCCNPDHIFIGTISDNQTDMAQKHRSTIGERNPMAVLTFSDALKIKNLYEAGGLFQREIGDLFGIGQAHVSQIVNGALWAKNTNSLKHNDIL